MSYFAVEIKPYRDHRSDPSISVYVTNNLRGREMEKISCMYCKRTIFDLKGTIDKIITTPMPVEDFGIATNIMCKLCHQSYRLLLNAN